ncbi:hypothetical protein RND81_13G167300 [Saponaria officinalis]|uniref:Uncharacterized protein n=1 Tax=Saponaria officinalis TaxID=3572 RepID=A0AAW1H0T2_SAPOF
MLFSSKLNRVPQKRKHAIPSPVMMRRRMKRKHRERRRSKPHGPPPPPPTPPLPPRPEEWGDGFTICVQFSRMIDKTASFLRFKIPYCILNNFQSIVNSDRIRGVISYVRHHHHLNSHCFEKERFFEFSLDPQINGPFTSDLSVFCSTSVLGSVVYGLDGGSPCDGKCHCFRYADFGQMVPRWNISKQLLCHRFSPKVVTVNNDLYVFEERGVFAVDDEYCPSSSHPFRLLI